MYIIKSCPSCSKKIRFPIDKGKIQVRCACGHAFIADPDDTSLYRDAVFDLKKSSRDSAISRYTKKIMGRIRSTTPAGMVRRLIGIIYDAKYKLQNFRLMTAREKAKALVVMLIIASIIAAAVFWLSRSGSSGDGMII